MAWIYLLECSDGSFSVGSTTNLDLRLQQHHAGGGAAYTTDRRPVRLLWAGEFERASEAYAFERRVHGWSRAKKRALAEGAFSDLPLLSSRSWAGRRAQADALREDRPLA